MTSPIARIFLSSTFRDFGEERDLLVRRVFPALRARLRERFVELVDVDLRWGITVEQAERGEVLPICMAEIDRARPWFVCMLGDRYGWVPPAEHYDHALVEQRPWLAKHQGGKSVTELEILHGVLNNPAMAGRAFFYFRDPAYARAKGGDYVSASSEDTAKLEDLKNRIRASGFPVIEDYPTPEAMAERLEADLSAAFDEAFPVEDMPDAFAREQRKHEAYAAPRRGLYLGGNRYITALDAALAAGQQRILIGGASGGGKSALLANWLHQHRAAHPSATVHAYYLGASGDATDPEHLVRHLIEHIRRVTGNEEAAPNDRQALFDSLPTWLGYASSHAGRTDTSWLIAFDGLNTLADLQDLRWFPAFLPERVHLIVSCLPGDVETALHGKGEWHSVVVAPLDHGGAQQLLRTYLGLYNKTLPNELEDRVLSHPLAHTPLFLRTLAEELRLFGSHEALSERLDYYLQSSAVDDLYERVLERVEGDCGADTVRKLMTALWASRAGLSEPEILAYVGLVPATWAAIRYALNNALLESGGRLTFAHDYLRIAVSDRYMAGNGQIAEDGQSQEAVVLRRQAHINLVKWFDNQFRADADGEDQILVGAARAAEEVPYQWHAARAWNELKACLTRQEMFEVVYATRSNEELLGYWLDLEHYNDGHIDRDYEQAWATWNLDQREETTGDLSDKIASFLRFAGRYGKFTTKLAQTSLEIIEKAQGPDHPSTGARVNNLALLLLAKGDYPAAESLFRRALKITEKAQGPDHPSMGISLNCLAGVLEAQGDYAAAEPLYRRALSIVEKAQGPEHPDMGASLNNLATLLESQGRYAAAEPLYRRALEISEKAQGPEHPETGIRLNNLAGLRKAQGDYAEAEPYYRRALSIAEKAQGPEHPNTGNYLHNLAVLLMAQGDYAAAEPLYRRALAIAEKVLGPEHPSTGDSLNDLALLLESQGDYAAAEPLYRRALAIAEKVLGPDHPGTGTSLNNLAALLEAQGDYAAAEPLFLRALWIAEKTLGPEHPDTGTRLNNLAALLESQGKYAAAEPLYRRALAIAEKSQGPEHISTGISLNNLAFLLQAQGDYAAAEPLYRRALAIVEKAQGAEHPDTRAILYNLTGLLKAKDNYAEAEPLYRKLLTITEKIKGAVSNDVARLKNSLGDLLCNAGLFEKAEIELEDALHNWIALGNDLGMAATLSTLGKLRELQANREAALEFYNRCLEIRERLLPPDNPSLALVRERIAELEIPLR